MAAWPTRWRQYIKALKADTYAIALAFRDPRTPWYAKVLIGFVVIHTLSPIDLIPDFIPVLGYLDDILIVPLGVALALRMVPEDVMTECRQEATKLLATERPTSWIAGIIVLAVWLVGVGLLALVLGRVLDL